jgi:hypothetical protein
MESEEVRSEDLFLVELILYKKKVQKQHFFCTLHFFFSLIDLNVKQVLSPHSSLLMSSLFSLFSLFVIWLVLSLIQTTSAHDAFGHKVRVQISRWTPVF